ncbi:MAG: radical SAM protein [Candidatus Woesearchaeota archaeon]
MELEKKLDEINAFLPELNTGNMLHSSDVFKSLIINKSDVTKNIASELLNKSINGLSSLENVAYLLNNKKSLNISELVSLAKDVNIKLHEKQIGFYAVSYISDLCINNCVYCGHSKDVIQQRRILDESEMLMDFTEALKLGPSEICILAGEHKLVSPEKLAKAINIAKVADVHTALDRVILNVAPMTTEEFKDIRKLTTANIQYRIFQESYDKETYTKNHPTGPKKNFSNRLHAQERALDAGIDEVGIGALLGINKKNSDFEIVALVAHAYHLLETKGKLPYSLSIPRLKSVSDKNIDLQHSISDENYILYHAILRIALPFVKLVVTTRETSEMQTILRPMINIHDLDTKPGVGGNYLKNVHSQNDVGDNRLAMDRVLEIKNQGYNVILKGI